MGGYWLVTNPVSADVCLTSVGGVQKDRCGRIGRIRGLWVYKRQATAAQICDSSPGAPFGLHYSAGLPRKCASVSSSPCVSDCSMREIVIVVVVVVVVPGEGASSTAATLPTLSSLAKLGSHTRMLAPGPRRTSCSLWQKLSRLFCIMRLLAHSCSKSTTLKSRNPWAPV